MNPALAPLFDSPSQHFFSIDADNATFLGMDRAAYHRSIFLDRRLISDGNATQTRPMAALMKAAEHVKPASVGWIFHIAHCGSTLLARLIDQPESGLILREPPPLRQLGVSHARGDASAAWHDRMHLAHVMVSRRFDPVQPTIVKANVPVNFILPQLIEREANAPTLLLYFALQPYLLAVLRSPGHRTWVDRVTDQLAPALAARVGLRPHAATAERAAALWLAQMLMFDAALGANPEARSLDAEVLFANPADVAHAAAHHFSLSSAGLDANLNALASANAKDPTQPFDNTTRRARQAKDLGLLQNDIDIARHWIMKAVAAEKLPQNLTRPLFGAAPRLMI